jgi:hypothetical protein
MALPDSACRLVIMTRSCARSKFREPGNWLDKFNILVSVHFDLLPYQFVADCFYMHFVLSFPQLVECAVHGVIIHIYFHTFITILQFWQRNFMI